MTEIKYITPRGIKLYFSLFLTLIFSPIIGNNIISNHSVFLISNLVDVKNNDQFITRLEAIFNTKTEPFSVIINGDLVNSKFDKNFKKDSIRIFKLLKSLSNYKNAKIIIVPGERDWADSKKSGLKNVKVLEDMIKDFDFDNIKWALKNGCPGPKEFDLQENLMLITINTQWWNHPYEVPGPIDGDCKIATTDDFKEELEDLLNENPDKNIIVAGHYPILSNGEYGGHQPFYKHIFPLTDWIDELYIPLPIFGTIYTSFRENIGTNDDIINENYEETRKMLENIISQYQSIIYVSGHDKTQQIAESFGNYFINSGAPEKGKFSSNIEECVFSDSKPGIIEIEYHADGKVSSVFHEFKKKMNTSVTSKLLLLESSCKENYIDHPVNYQFQPCKGIKVSTEIMTKKYPVNSKIIAGPEYEAGNFRRFLMGDHYRDSWTAEVEVPYLNLDTAKGGLTVLKRGGGRQTLSLKFQGGNGIRYTFRSVNKDPIKALDYDLRETAIANIVKDQTTTQHPYGAMAADILLNELDIIHAHPKLYLMPDDPKLGPFQKDFGNMLGMLEENPANPKNGNTGYLGASEIVRSNKLFRKLYNDHNYKVDSKEFAIARVFDFLVGDWGKHDDNWKWVGFKEKGKTNFRPMPRDRDHVFSRWDGVLPWLFDREWAKPSGEDFNYEIVGLRSLMNQARHLDRFLASDLSKDDWLEAAKFVQTKITDNIIETAVRNMPQEVYELSGKEIENKLKARVKDLNKYALEYYEMISPEVDIVGSNKKEYFDVIRNFDGSVTVSVYDIKSKHKGENVFYSRILKPDETNDIRLYGLDGRDIFNISGNCDKSIQIRIIGGTGKDSINDVSSSDAQTLVYDKGKKTIINKGYNTELVKPYNSTLYKYNRTSFAYDTYFPLPYISFSADDGLILNAGVSFTLHNYDKQDYSANHNIQIGASTNKSYGIEYEGRFHHVIEGWDITLAGFYFEPRPFTYFYGMGNETEKDEDKFNQNYYRTRYVSRGFSIGLVNDFWKKSSLSIEASYQNNEHQEESKITIFHDQNFIGSGKINLIEGTASLSLDFRNRSTLPTNGTLFYAEYNNGFVTNLDYNNYGKLLLIGTGYISLPKFFPLTMGLKAGVGKSFGKIPFYNQFNLGQNTYLKGYRNNRFTGKSIAFLQAGLRMNLLGFDGSVVPMKIGILGFFNAGRVYQSGESSTKWHSGYGGGLFIIPLREEFTIYTTLSFSEEESMLFEFGLGSAL
jgi:Omp85 superfamily domain